MKEKLQEIYYYIKLEVNSSYLRTAGVKKRADKIGKKIEINKKYLEDSLHLLENILVYVKDQIHEKFKEYTSEKVLTDVWSFMFKSPMLNFYDYWETQDGQIIAFKSEIAERRMKNLSSSEKTLLSIWLLHFSSSILNRNFSFYDINGWYSLDSESRNEIIFLIEILNRHPYLLSGKQ